MSAPAPQIVRAGVGEPLFLLHGVTGSATMWKHVVPLVGRHFDAIAPSALGHSGGREPRIRPARIEHLLDDLELTMDELGIETAHFAGNSMGGWMALEMARRGRARSVCALSPAGTWDGESAAHRRTRSSLKRDLRLARIARPVLPLAARSAWIRRDSMKLNAVHGDRIAPADMIEVADATLGCVVANDILDTPESLAPIDPVPCPIAIHWSGEDNVLPLGENGRRARELVPNASFEVMPGIGHVPMFDDPELVARTIVEVASAAG